MWNWLHWKAITLTPHDIRVLTLIIDYMPVKWWHACGYQARPSSPIWQKSQCSTSCLHKWKKYSLIKKHQHTQCTWVNVQKSPCIWPGIPSSPDHNLIEHPCEAPDKQVQVSIPQPTAPKGSPLRSWWKTPQDSSKGPVGLYSKKSQHLLGEEEPQT